MSIRGALIAISATALLLLGLIGLTPVETARKAPAVAFDEACLNPAIMPTCTYPEVAVPTRY